LAKQLIHETRLPMAEVALASGFGSIRRFNEIFQRLFDRPPCALRCATAFASSRQVGEVTILLGYRPPYDWATMVAFLKARAIPGVEVVSNDRYARTIELEGVHGVVAVEPTSGNALRVAIRFSRLSALPTIIARVRRVFDLAADPQAVNAQLAEDPILAPLVAARPAGTRCVGRVRAGRSGRARSANHGGRRSRPCREARDALWRAAGRERPENGGADPCLSSS
jgi:AraC family transcriptional regulator of adaptative response / DNA-3-methyladenine glycosylase II